MSIIGHAKPLWRKHDFPVIPHLLSFLFMSPREVSKLFYFATCIVPRKGRSIRDVRRLLPQFCLLSAIYLFRDTVFAFARQNIARRVRKSGMCARVFRDAFRWSPVSFISSRERRILDFEMYAVKFANFLSVCPGKRDCEK